MRRIEQINDLLREKLAYLISQEMPIENGLVTISYVDCAPNLKSAKIGISVLPDKLFGTTIEKLNKLNSFFSETIRKETRLRQIPRFRWVVDDTEKHAEKLEEVFREIKREE